MLSHAMRNFINSIRFTMLLIELLFNVSYIAPTSQWGTNGKEAVPDSVIEGTIPKYQSNKPSNCWSITTALLQSTIYGIPDRTRTCNLQLRRLLLNPIKLRGQNRSWKEPINCRRGQLIASESPHSTLFSVNWSLNTESNCNLRITKPQ